jgi:hypothetical protein
MKLEGQHRAPNISGINVLGENVSVDYSDYLLNIVLFFDLVSRASIENVNAIQLLARRYQKFSIGFWYIMEPRLSCLYKGEIARSAIERSGLPLNTIFDANGLIILQTGIKSTPAVLVIDSFSLMKSEFEGEISYMELERAIQARLSMSGYKDDLPTLGEFHVRNMTAHSGAIMRQLGYATGDYLFTSLVVPETDQEFSLPDFCQPNTIYPHGAWFVGRDYIEGKAGSTVYISCSKDESVNIFAGSEEKSKVKIHASIESDAHIIFGKDVTKSGGCVDMTIDEFRSYEVLSSSGDADALISLQIASGSVMLFCVEYCQHSPFVNINI